MYHKSCFPGSNRFSIYVYSKLPQHVLRADYVI